MLTGKRFYLTRSIAGIQLVDGERIIVEIPQGETIQIISGPRADDIRMVDVMWQSQTFVMFAEDVIARGELIEEKAAGQEECG